MEKETICNNANAIFDRLLNAYSCMSAFKSIKSVYDRHEEYLFLSGTNFWRMVTDNCIFRTLVELSKIYDEGKDAVGLKKLINQVEQSKTEFENAELVHTAKEKYAALSNSKEKLKTLRDKGLVHSDKEYMADPKQLISEYAPSLPEIYALLNTAAEICNDILVEYTGERRSVTRVLFEDASGVISDLKLAYEAKKKRFKKSMQ